MGVARIKQGQNIDCYVAVNSAHAKHILNPDVKPEDRTYPASTLCGAIMQDEPRTLLQFVAMTPESVGRTGDLAEALPVPMSLEDRLECPTCLHIYRGSLAQAAIDETNTPAESTDSRNGRYVKALELHLQADNLRKTYKDAQSMYDYMSENRKEFPASARNTQWEVVVRAQNEYIALFNVTV